MHHHPTPWHLLLALIVIYDTIHSTFFHLYCFSSALRPPVAFPWTFHLDLVLVPVILSLEFFCLSCFRPALLAFLFNSVDGGTLAEMTRGYIMICDHATTSDHPSSPVPLSMTCSPRTASMVHRSPSVLSNSWALEGRGDCPLSHRLMPINMIWNYFSLVSWL